MTVANNRLLIQGGAAFPSEDDNSYWHGMTLREYFAARSPVTIFDAMIALGMSASSVGMLDEADRKAVFSTLAKMSLEYADAMLAERAK